MLRSAQKRKRVKSGLTLGGGVALKRHGKPSPKHGALPRCAAQQPSCSAWVLDGRVSYKEERYRPGKRNRIALYPWSGALAEEEMSPTPKATEQAHMADDGLASASATYADFRLAAAQAARKRRLLRIPPGEAKPAAHLAKRTRRKPASVVATGSSPGGTVASTGTRAGPRSSHGIKAMLRIGAFGNKGLKMSLIALPADKSVKDHGTDACGDDAQDPRRAVVWWQWRSTGPRPQNPRCQRGFGNGVFTTSDMLASTTLPVKSMLLILMD